VPAARTRGFAPAELGYGRCSVGIWSARLSSAAQSDSSATRNFAFASICTVVGSLALWLAWPEEVIARHGPYDQVRYLAMAESIGAGQWLGEYDVLTLIRDPGYPVWLAAVDASGIPLRIANECLMLLAAALMAAGLRRLGVSNSVAAIFFALAVLQPHGPLVLRELLPSGLFTAATWIALAGFCFGTTRPDPLRRSLHFAWAGLALGVMWTTRPERPLVALLALGFVAVDFANSRGPALRERLTRAAASAVLFCVGIATCALPISALNLGHYGVWRISDPAAPGFAAANRALVSIVQHEPRRRVPVPEEVRRRAYAASPTFREFSKVLEAENWARGVSCRLDSVCDDIAGGYFRWILREAAAATVPVLSADALDGQLRTVASEIETACAAGELECRSRGASFLHPVPAVWIPHLPDAFRRVVERLGARGDPRNRAGATDAPGLDPGLTARFDAVANRRSELAHAPTDRIDVFVRVGEGRLRAAQLETRERRMPLELGESENGRYRIALSVDQPATPTLRDYPQLTLERVDGRIAKIPLPQPGDTADQDGIQVETESWQRGVVAGAYQREVRRALWMAHAAWVRTGSVLAIAAAVALVLGWRKRALEWNAAWGALALIALLVISRVALLTLIDASSFAARSSRYLYPIASLYAAGLVLLIHLVWSRLATRPPPGA
jgi:hypothetical protein